MFGVRPFHPSPDLLAPPPLHRQPGQHHRLAGPDRRHPGGAGRVVVAQILGVEKVGDHADAALLDRGGGRVFVLVDHVLVERLGHQLLGLGIHPRRHERRQVQPAAAVEHQFVVDEPISGVGVHTFIGHPQRGDRRHRQPPGVRRGDLWSVSSLARHGKSFPIERRWPPGHGRECVTPTSVPDAAPGLRRTDWQHARERRPPRRRPRLQVARPRAARR